MVKLIWVTPNADEMIAQMARVSNPNKEQEHETAPRLINYMIRNKHWSPFDMADICVEIKTTRDIGRQILRHSSFKFQEFSQRYADVGLLNDAPVREARMQHPTNRQSSIPCTDVMIEKWWIEVQKAMTLKTMDCYNSALELGIAKEVARAILPEGLTPTRMYMKGTLRSWIHFCEVRRHPSTQKETRDIADQCWAIMEQECPMIAQAVSISNLPK